jgi:hypothetical protein
MAWMPRNLFRVWPVPRSLASQRVKIPPVLFTRNLLKNKALPKKQCFLVKVFAKQKSFEW